MKLSKAIEIMQALLAEHGDADFVLDDADEGCPYHLEDDNFSFEKGKHRVGISYWANHCAD